MPIRIKPSEPVQPTKFMQKIKDDRKTLGIPPTKFAEICNIKPLDYSECEQGYQAPTAFEMQTMQEVLSYEFEKMMKHNKDIVIE